jgi:hypothetical protein
MSRLTASSSIGARVLSRGVMVAVLAAVAALALVWAVPPGSAATTPTSATTLTIHVAKHAIAPNTGFTITGTLADTTAPIEAATVTFTATSPSGTIPDAITNSSGAFSTTTSGLPAGTWTLTATYADPTYGSTAQTTLYVGTGSATVTVNPQRGVIPARRAFTVSGQLADRTDNAPGGRIVSLTAALPGKPARALGQAHTTAAGTYALPLAHGLPTTGQWRITATFADPAYVTARGARDFLIGLASPVRLATSTRVATYGGSIRLTAIVGGWASGNWVYIYRIPFNRTSASLVARARIGRTGRVVVTTKPLARTRYYAYYPGNFTHRPGTSGAVTVQVRVALRFFADNASATKSGVAIFKYNAKCVSYQVGCPSFTAAIRPRLNGVPTTFAWQVYASGRWATIAVKTWTTEAGGLSGVWFQYDASWTKYLFRLQVRAAPAASYGLAPTTSAWIRWRVVR